MSDPLGLLSRQTQNDSDPLGLMAAPPAILSPKDTGDIDLRDTPAPTATPAPGRVAPKPAAPRASIGETIRGSLRGYQAMGLPGASVAGSIADVGDIYADDRKQGGIARAPDARTDQQRRTDAARAVPTVRPEQTATPTQTYQTTRTGNVVTQAEGQQHDERQRQQIEATNKENFTPEHWAEVAQRGIELGNKLHAEGKHDEAQDVLRKAYNAQQLSTGSKKADTFGAIALSNLLGIVSDPYARQRQNMREAAEPGATFSAEEQRSQLDMNKSAAPERGFEYGKDLAAPLVGQLPVIVAGGAVGRGALALAGGGLERAGATRIGQGLARLAQPIEEATQFGPAAPFSRAGAGVKTMAFDEAPALWRTRVAEETASLQANLPKIVARGATEGQIVGAVQSYRMAREQGATPGQALTAIADALPLQAGIGVAGESVMAVLGRALKIGYDPVGRATGALYDRVRSGPEVDRPLDRRQDIPLDRYAGTEEVGQALPPRGEKMAELGQNFDQLLAGRRGERGRDLTDTFAGQDRTPAGADFWENLPNDEPKMSAEDEARMASLERVANGTNVQRALREEAHTQMEALREKYSQPAGQGMDARLDDRPVDRPLGPLQSAEPQPGRSDRLRTAAEIATGEERPPLQPHEEADAFHRMQRANESMDRYKASVEAEQNDPNTVLERAAQARPGEQQGPRTLTETLSQTADEVRAGEPLATEYHDAINTYADAAAAVKDAETPTTQQRMKLARARRVLDDARKKYGTQFGASAVLALAANNDDLSDEEKELVGLGGLAILSTDVVKFKDEHPLMGNVGFHSRLKNAVEALPKAWNEPRPAADWVGKLTGTNTLSKRELELIKPALQEASRNKVKLSRADVMAIAEERVPKIEQVTLGAGRRLDKELAAHGDSEDILDMDAIDRSNPDEIHDQIANRQAEYTRLEEYIESEVAEARSSMEDAEHTLDRKRNDIEETLDRNGINTHLIRPALDYISERVEGEHVPRDVWKKALQEVIDDVRVDRTPEESFESAGWSVKEETKRPFDAEFTDKDGEHHVEAMEFDGDETVAQAKAHLAEEHGISPDDIEITELPEETEFVAYNDYDNEQGRGEDKDDLMQEMVNDHGLDDGANDELYSELLGDLEAYAYAYSDYQQAESEHYYRNESDSSYEEERSKMSELEDEMRDLRSAHDDAVEAAADAARELEHAQPTDHALEQQGQLALPEVAGQDTGRPPGEPIAVVEPEENVIPISKGNALFSSYQRIPGGRNYREMLNVWSNNPGKPYTTSHYGNKGFANVIAHVRAEDHSVRFGAEDLTQLVEPRETDATAIGNARTKLKEKIAERDTLLGLMKRRADEYDALPPDQREGARAQEIAREYASLNEKAVGVGEEIDRFAETVSDKKQKPRNVAVMVESQSDWAQDAGRVGVRDPERAAQVQAKMNELRAEREKYLAANSKLEHEIYNSDSENKVADLKALKQTDEYLKNENEADVLQQQMDEVQDTAPKTGAVPESPYIEGGTNFNPKTERFDAEGKQAYALNAARFLMDSAQRGHSDIAWSDGANRMKNAHLPLDAARLVYDEMTPSIITKLLSTLGFKVKPDKIFIKGEGHWHIELTQEMRKAIKRSGLPLLGVIAATALPEDAEAQGPDGKPQQASLFTTTLGGIAAGAALMYLAKNRKVRRLVKENRELERALMVDDLSGLANKKAFMRAQASVDHDPKFHWVVLDGDRFKTMNDVHGHAEGDKAIQHFGKTVMNVSEQMGIPMRGFRFGGDEIAFAAPAEHAAEFMKRVQEQSAYTKGDVSTKLTGAFGKTFEEADALMNATKEANRVADPSLRRPTKAPVPTKGEPPVAGGGATLYANPIGPALRELARYPSAATMGGLALLLSESDNKDLQKTALPMAVLAALSAVGSRRLAAGRDKLGSLLLDKLGGTGTSIARAFNPEALIPAEAREAIGVYEADLARAKARGAEFAKASKAVGPEGDRAVSDVLENEEFEDVSQMPPQQMQAVLTAASALGQEYDDISKGLVSSGARDPLELLPNYAGPRRYAYHDAHAAQTEGGAARNVGEKPRISGLKHRTLDEPLRRAQDALDAATQSGDPQAISDAQDKVDAAKVEQLSKREELGEIRESSYRAAQGIERGHADIAAANLFSDLRDVPGVVHPEWLQAADDLDAAKQMRASATTPADRATADGLVNDAKLRMNDLTRDAEKKGGEFVALPDTRAMGKLRGAVVQRDVANSLVGFSGKNPYLKMLRLWKQTKTIFNPGTHAANVLSNIAFSHMEGLPMWEQPAYLKRASKDMKAYGPATRALAEAGVLDLNAATAEGEGVAANRMNTQEGLEQLLPTTRQRTADVLREQGITEIGAKNRARRQLVKGAAAGAALGAAKFVNTENPEDAAIGAIAGAGVGALLTKGHLKLRTLYQNEDNIFRAAIWLKKVKSGMTPDEATAYTREALGNFRTRSPAIHVLKSSIAPFILYPAKALPRFAAQVVDHPWRYAALMAAWGGLNELSKHEVGETDEADLKPSDRRPFGYALPGFTQLPFSNKAGDKAGVDLARWTPVAAATTAAPPGSVPASFDESLPDIFRISGPATDLSARLGANVDPYSGKPAYARDYPPSENATHLVNDLAGTALPPAADFHATRIRDDIRNRDFDKLQNDALGPTGLRPRFTRPGAQMRESAFTLENSLREMKQDLRRSLINNKNEGRVEVLISRYQRHVKQAFDNFRERTGQEPPQHLIDFVTSPEQ